METTAKMYVLIGSLGKMCVFFFFNQLRTTPRLHIEILKSSQHNASVQSLAGWPTTERPIAAKCWRGRGRKFLGGKHIFSCISY